MRTNLPVTYLWNAVHLDTVVANCARKYIYMMLVSADVCGMRGVFSSWMHYMYSVWLQPVRVYIHRINAAEEGPAHVVMTSSVNKQQSAGRWQHYTCGNTTYHSTCKKGRLPILSLSRCRVAARNGFTYGKLSGSVTLEILILKHNALKQSTYTNLK